MHAKLKLMLARATFLVAALALSLPAFAQSGKLAGRVVDEQGEPLIGATVFLLGTSLGAAADLNGEYGVIQIPPGTYSVRFSIIGFQTQIVEGVLISSNNTTTLNVTLGEEVLQGEEVIVTAERPIVDVSLTSSMATLSKDDIDVLPVQQLEDIVNLQAGVVDGHFRGGRSGEVQWQVDGISVNNPYDNSSSLKLDRSVLQEVQVISGTFDAEYGQAMSGVVNAVLRSGDADRYSFSAEVYSGDYFSPGNDSTDVRDFFGDVSRVALYPNIENISPSTRQNYQFNLNGPVPFVPNTTFLFNGQRFIDEGYLTGVRRFVPTDSSDFESKIFNGTGDGEIVSLDYNYEWSGLAKLSNRSIKNLLIEYQAITNSIRSTGYNHGFRFNPDGANENKRFSIVHGLDLGCIRIEFESPISSRMTRHAVRRGKQRQFRIAIRIADGHFRGGRSGEVQWQVDGISVNNPYDNSSSLKLDRSVLQEVQVISGTLRITVRITSLVFDRTILTRRACTMRTCATRDTLLQDRRKATRISLKGHLFRALTSAGLFRRQISLCRRVPLPVRRPRFI